MLPRFISVKIYTYVLDQINLCLPDFFYKEEAVNKSGFDFKLYLKIVEIYSHILRKIDNEDEIFIEELQLKRLKNVLAAANQTVWWKEYFKKNLIDINSIKDIRDLEKIPPVTRYKLINSPRQDFLTLPEESEKIVWRSSGGSTTGTPFWWGLNKDLLTLNVFSRFINEFQRSENKPDQYYDFKKNFYLQFNYPHVTPRSEFKWFSNGDYNVKSFDENIDEKLNYVSDIIKKSFPCVIRTTPTELLFLAKEVQARQWKLPISVVSVTGQMLDMSTRKFAEETLGCKILLHYGAQEIGPLAFQCELNRDIYHLFKERAIVEILNEEGGTVPNEQPGDITITCLDNKVMPLIRYQLGDVGILRKRKICNCGKNGQTLEMTRRATDVIKYSDGTKKSIMPLIRNGFNKEPYLNLIRRFQVRQDKLDEIILILEVKKELTDAVKESLVSFIHSKYEKKLNVVIQETPAIPHEGKFKVFIPLN